MEPHDAAEGNISSAMCNNEYSHFYNHNFSIVLLFVFNTQDDITCALQAID